jgi:hypothetical protein
MVATVSDHDERASEGRTASCFGLPPRPGDQKTTAKGSKDGRWEGLAISVTVGETAVLKAFPGADALWAVRAGRSVTNPSRKGRRTCAPTKRKPRSARGKSHVRRMSGQLGDLGESESRPARLE